MMTVLELIDAIEDAGVDYDDPIVIVRPVVGKADERYAVTHVAYSEAPANDTDVVGGHVRVVISPDR
jgi:hypothetical protein